MRFLAVIYLLLFSHFNICWGNCDSILLKWDQIKGKATSSQISTLHQLINSAYSNKEYQCIADAYRRIGTFYKNNAQYDSAVSAYIKSAKYAFSTGDVFSQASTYNQIAIIYTTLHDTTKAINYFKDAYIAYNKVGSERGMGDASNNLAELYYYTHKTLLALKECTTSIKHKIQSDTSTIGDNYILLSKIYLSQKDIRHATEYAYKGVLFYSSVSFGNNSDLAASLLQLGDVYKSIQSIDSSIKYYSNAYYLSSTNPEFNYTCALNLFHSYQSVNNCDSALFYSEKCIQLSRLIHNETRLSNAHELAVRYETEKKNMEIAYQARLSENRLWLLVALSIVLFFLVLIVFMLAHNILQRKKILAKEQEVKTIGDMLRGQDIERERIAKELHDRVGSMLSTVKLHFSTVEQQMAEMRLLQSQSYNKALELLDETYEEVRRISHDLDAGLLNKFGLKTAVEQLIHTLEETNRLKVVFIDNNLEATVYKKYETDLYRITQELLTNTIKYASAYEVSIQISKSGSNLIYSYEDDGKGFDKDTLNLAAGMGYRNIDSRVRTMGGKWFLETSINNGMNLIIEIPIV